MAQAGDSSCPEKYDNVLGLVYFSQICILRNDMPSSSEMIRKSGLSLTNTCYNSVVEHQQPNKINNISYIQSYKCNA